VENGNGRSRMATQKSADKLRVKLAKLGEQCAVALEEFNRVIADPTSSLGAIDKADARVKQLTSERNHLVEELRLAEFETPDRFGPYRRGAGQRPMREQILDLVDELGVPVFPRTVSEYALAVHQISLPPARFASVRRDEARAYERDPQSRPAWVVPAINIVGLTAIPRLVTSSAWPLERRLIASRTLRVNHLKLLLVFIRRLSTIETNESDMRKMLSALIYRSAAGIASPNGPGFEAMEARVKTELVVIEPDDESDRKKAADALGRLPARFQMWGQPSVIDGGVIQKERTAR
jgi:hypothetical protein